MDFELTEEQLAFKQTAKEFAAKEFAPFAKEWDEKHGMFKNQPLHDWTSNAADMLRYAALVENKMSNELNTNEGLSANEIAKLTNIY